MNNLINYLLITIWLFLVSFASASEISEKIDQLLEEDYKESSITPNDFITDSVFLRRAYTNVIGRIPTSDEALNFYKETNPEKRKLLIKQLIDSRGFSGKMFLFYSNLLRLKTNYEQHGIAFHHYIYNATLTNQPYDKFVKGLLEAEGHVAEQQGVSYYLRDRGMLLDNVSNTSQVFLGSQIGCAQCHDDPFSPTTQLDFYKMAAFNGGLDYQESAAVKNIVKNIMISEATKDGVDIDALKLKKKGGIYNSLKKYAQPVIPVFQYYRRNTLTDVSSKVLKLPHDYQYSDGKPNQIVQPHVVFGSMPPLDGSKSSRSVFAKWVTSPDNPMFAKVIANRLWDNVFGHPLANTLDNWNSRTKVSHEQVLNVLAEELVHNGFNIKKTMSDLYNTKLFQRKVSTKEVTQGEVFKFSGPLLRRMTAEEIYDSMLTLKFGNLDEKINPDLNKNWNSFVTNFSKVQKLSPKELLSLGKKVSAVVDARDKIQREILVNKNKIAKAKKAKDFQLESTLKKARTDLEKRKKEMYQSSTMMSSMSSMSSMNSMGTQHSESSEDLVKFSLGRNISISSKPTLRTYEQPQPFKPGSFIRTFGGTDGEVTNNFNKKASITQALAMLNGKELRYAIDSKAQIRNQLKEKASPKERLDLTFLSIYSRFPTEQEEEQFLPLAKQDDTLELLVKAMINSKQFLFIQ